MASTSRSPTRATSIGAAERMRAPDAAPATSAMASHWALASGLGYVAWYTVAPRLALGGVAAVQLATPVATAALAWPLLDEVPSARLAVAAALVVGGIALAVWRTNGGVARDDEAG